MSTLKKERAVDVAPISASDQNADVAGTTFGAAGGAIIGGVAGSLAGPGGTVVGALAGAAAGGAIGKLVGAGGWADNDNYWRDHFHEQSFYREGFKYRDYEDAFRFGHEQRADAGHLSFEEHSPALQAKWEQGGHPLTWDEARHAAKAAWERQVSAREQGGK